MPGVGRVRRVSAYVVWALSCLGALALAGASLLVALKVDPASVWGWWLEAADVIAVGWFDRRPQPAIGGVDVRDTVVRWGSGAVALLGVGATLQWVVRPRALVR